MDNNNEISLLMHILKSQKDIALTVSEANLNWKAKDGIPVIFFNFIKNNETPPKFIVLDNDLFDFNRLNKHSITEDVQRINFSLALEENKEKKLPKMNIDFLGLETEEFSIILIASKNILDPELFFQFAISAIKQANENIFK